MPVIIFYMARAFIRQSPLAVRALFTLGVLLSLCVSDTVGPRLLPLPAVAAHAAAHPLTVEAFSTAPSEPNPTVVRVAMAAPARRQEGAGHHLLQAATPACGGHITPPGEARTFRQTTCSQSPISSAAVTRPPGRAPPLSV